MVKGGTGKLSARLPSKTASTSRPRLPREALRWAKRRLSHLQIFPFISRTAVHTPLPFTDFEHPDFYFLAISGSCKAQEGPWHYRPEF